MFVVIVFYFGFEGKDEYDFYDKNVKVELIGMNGCVMFVGN